MSIADKNPFFNSKVLLGGGSTIISFQLTKIMYPEVDLFGSKPCELPKIAMPKTEGVNYHSLYLNEFIGNLLF